MRWMRALAALGRHRSTHRRLAERRGSMKKAGQRVARAVGSQPRVRSNESLAKSPTACSQNIPRAAVHPQHAAVGHRGLTNPPTTIGKVISTWRAYQMKRSTQRCGMSGRANTYQLRTQEHVPNSKTEIVELLVGQGNREVCRRQLKRAKPFPAKAPAWAPATPHRIKPSHD